MSAHPAPRRLADRPLLEGLARVIARERAALVDVLAYIGEVERRRLYVAEGYPSMYLYCVQHLHLSEQAALKRIRAARLVRRFPPLASWLADGRIHLSALVVLLPYIDPGNAAELFALARHRTRRGLERLLAERYPRPDLPTSIRPLGPAPLSPGTVAAPVSSAPVLDQPGPALSLPELSPGTVLPPAAPLSPGTVAAAMPSAPQRFALQVTIDQDTHALLTRAQELLAHQPECRQVPDVLRRALQLLVQQLEKQRLAATHHPRPRGERGTESPRHIPAHVKRAVRERDQDRCTYVSATGHRCGERSMLEFDHIVPVARGGMSTTDNVRQRCRAHNQYAAEQVFGIEFMRAKREGPAAAGPALADCVSTTGCAPGGG